MYVLCARDASGIALFISSGAFLGWLVELSASALAGFLPPSHPHPQLSSSLHLGLPRCDSGGALKLHFRVLQLLIGGRAKEVEWRCGSTLLAYTNLPYVGG